MKNTFLSTILTPAKLETPPIMPQRIFLNFNLIRGQISKFGHKYERYNTHNNECSRNDKCNFT